MTIAVTGGTGFVGKAFLHAALSAGHEVRALTRKEQPGQRGIQWQPGDLGAPDALRALSDRAEVLVHIAGLTTSHEPRALEEANVAGTMAVIRAARAAGVPRLVFVSSLSARDPGLSAYGQSKHRAERLVKASGLDWTIVRPPAVYGPGDRDMFELFRAAKWGVVPVPSEGRTSLIHADDLAALLVALLPGGEPVVRRTYEPDDGKPGAWNHRELALAIGWAMGRRPVVIGLRPGAMRWAAKADRMLRRDGARLTLDRVSYMCQPDWAVSQGAEPPKHLWQARIETRRGLRETAAWYREKGWL